MTCMLHSALCYLKAFGLIRSGVGGGLVGDFVGEVGGDVGGDLAAPVIDHLRCSLGVTCKIESTRAIDLAMLSLVFLNATSSCIAHTVLAASFTSYTALSASAQIVWSVFRVSPSLGTAFEMCFVTWYNPREGSLARRWKYSETMSNVCFVRILVSGSTSLIVKGNDEQ